MTKKMVDDLKKECLEANNQVDICTDNLEKAKNIRLQKIGAYNWALAYFNDNKAELEAFDKYKGMLDSE